MVFGNSKIKKKKLKKNFCNDFARGGGAFVPMGIFPNINMHKNIDYHLKI